MLNISREYVVVANSTNNNSNNGSFMESLLALLDSTWFLDSLYLFLITPLEFVSLGLNVLAFVALCRIHKIGDQAIYKYLRVYTLNASLACLVSIATFGSYSPRYFSFALALFTRYHRCILDTFVILTLYFFSNLLDVVIALDRLALVMPRRFERFKAYRRPYAVASLLCAVCVVTNLPVLFSMWPKSDEQFYNLTTVLPGQYCNTLAFAESGLGKAVNFVSYLLRDLITLALEIGLSVLTVVKVHSFRTSTSSVDSLNHGLHVQMLESERKLTLMTVCLSALSIFSHLVIFVASLSFLGNFDSVFKSWQQFFSSLSLSLKHFSIFFIIFYYSGSFQLAFKKIFESSV